METVWRGSCSDLMEEIQASAGIPLSTCAIGSFIYFLLQLPSSFHRHDFFLVSPDYEGNGNDNANAGLIRPSVKSPFMFYPRFPFSRLQTESVLLAVLLCSVLRTG